MHRRHADVRLPCRVEGSGPRLTTARVGLEPSATGSGASAEASSLAPAVAPTREPRGSKRMLRYTCEQAEWKKALVGVGSDRSPDTQALTWRPLTREYY